MALVGFSILAANGPLWAASTVWPTFATPAKTVGGGKNDAAVVIAIENYLFVPHIPGAKANAVAWYDYFTKTLQVPIARVDILSDNDATVEGIRKTIKKLATQGSKKGTIWVVFIGHGAPAKNGKDGLLIGVDAQQKAESIETRGIRRSELVAALQSSGAGAINIILDSCFSGRAENGDQLVAGLQPLLTLSSEEPIDPRVQIFTAATGDQYAGPLTGVQRPAFSYLLLGGLRGWADTDSQGKIETEKLLTFVTDALRLTAHDRTQTPQIIGRKDLVYAMSPGEKSPDLASVGEIEVQESEKLKRLRADAQRTIDESAAQEETQKEKLRELDREIASKKQMLEEARRKQKVLDETNHELDSITSRIESNSAKARSNLRRGMTKAQVTAILGPRNVRAGGGIYSDTCSIAGTYFLIFDGGVLTKVVELGSSAGCSGNIVDSCSWAVSCGESVVR
jgi:uncharacterized caspase-like protein